MPKTTDTERIDLIDVQHFWLCLHQILGTMIGDRPGDNDATFVWVAFNSCVKASSVLDLIDGKMLKLILKIKKPTDDDNDVPYEYIQKIYDTCEKILDIIGWPEDVSEE